ncbi:MAG: hypothetical protein H0U31_02000, partial [Chloroflexia bacterium]|nr:hypothetical protein [Chloroflexia bacterium]
LGELRVGVANKYLVFGTMRRPLPIVVDEIKLDWTHFNRPHREPFEPESGVYTVPEVFHSAWTAPDGSIGLFFANLHEQGDAALTIELPLATLGERSGSIVTVTATQPIGHPVQHAVAWSPTITIEAPPRVLVMVEVLKNVP